MFYFHRTSDREFLILGTLFQIAEEKNKGRPVDSHFILLPVSDSRAHTPEYACGTYVCKGKKASPAF